MPDTDFKEDIYAFAALCKTAADEHVKKKAYYTLVKKYHPDMQGGHRQEYDKYMMMVNHVYAAVKDKKEQESACDDIYEKMKINDKYCFVNRDKKKEYVSDKSLFLYKMGLDRIFFARDYICSHPLHFGYGEEIVFTASEALYQAINHLHNSLKIETSANWVSEAKEKIRWAYEMNNRITKSLYNTEHSLCVL